MIQHDKSGWKDLFDRPSTKKRACGNGTNFKIELFMPSIEWVYHELFAEKQLENVKSIRINLTSIKFAVKKGRRFFENWIFTVSIHHAQHPIAFDVHVNATFCFILADSLVHRRVFSLKCLKKYHLSTQPEKKIGSKHWSLETHCNKKNAHDNFSNHHL